jgi:hypothetical protein
MHASLPASLPTHKKDKQVHREEDERKQKRDQEAKDDELEAQAVKQSLDCPKARHLLDGHTFVESVGIRLPNKESETQNNK